MRTLVAVSVCLCLASSVSGLKCYTCWSVSPGSCSEVWNCPHHYEYCGSTIVAENLITQQCMRGDMCERVDSEGVRCCTSDLCNRGQQTKVSLLLVLFFICCLVM